MVFNLRSRIESPEMFLRRLQVCRAVIRALLWAFLLAGVSVGCSKEEIIELADQVQEKGEGFVVESKKVTDSLVRGPEEEEIPTGRMTIATPDPIEVDFALVKMHVVGDGRDQSLQITSYDPTSEAMARPAVLLHASTNVETVALLAGKPLKCNLFIQTELNSAIARTPVNEPVTVNFGAMNMQERSITATIDPCVLVGSDGETIDVSGGEIFGIVSGD